MKQFIASVLLILLASSARAEMIVNLHNEPHAWFTSGSTQTFTYLSADTVAIMNADGSISVSGGTDFRIQLAPLQNVSGSALAAGTCYARAMLAQSQNDGRPGIDVTYGDGSASNTMGQFHIRQLTVSSGQIQTLAVDFVEHASQWGGPALFGNVRINSDIAADTPFVAPVYAVTGELHFTASGFGIGSDAPGGMATIGLLQPALLVYPNSAAGISMSYLGPIGSDENGFWDLDFASGTGTPISIGSYENAQGYPFGDNGTPGLNFGYQGVGSSNDTGSFEVSQVDYESLDGDVQDFVTSFVNNSEGYTADQTVGQVTYHAVFDNGGFPDELFHSGFNVSKSQTPQVRSLQYPCSSL